MSTTGFEDLFKELVPARKKLVVEWPIESRETVTAAHSGGSRDPVEIMDNFDWTGFENEEPETLVVIDDVLTTGSHFRAFCDFLRENGYEGKIVGLFWARAVSASPGDVFDAVDDED